MALTLLSPAFEDGEHIPKKFTCDGEEHSPELTWGGAPDGTRGYALMMHDPDSSQGDFTHWILFNIPEDVTQIPESTEADRVGESATSDFETVGYGGPCPMPDDKAHRYIFTLYALDVDALSLGPTARRSEAEAAMQGHILDIATLTGYYQRNKNA